MLGDHTRLENIQSKTIDWLRFPLTVAVIFIHMNPEISMQNINYSDFTYADIFCIIATLGSNVISHIAVPCFYLFSGYLFFYKIETFNKSIYFNKMRKRINTLIVPYILWNILLIMITILGKSVKMNGDALIYINELSDFGILRLFWNCSEWGSNNINFLGWGIPNYGPVLLPLWFLRDLIMMVIISPLIYIFIDRTKIFGIIFLWILYYTKIWIIIPGFSSALFLSALCYFSLGAFFSINGRTFIESFRKKSTLWFIIAFISLILSTYFDGSDLKKYFMPVYITSGAISLINIVSYLTAENKLSISTHLSKASFFIYTTHSIVLLDLTQKILDKTFKFIFSSDNFFSLTFKYIFAPVICIFSVLIIYNLAKKFTPKVLNILTGDR